jgi:hypothetical protein
MAEPMIEPKLPPVTAPAPVYVPQLLSMSMAPNNNTNVFFIFILFILFDAAKIHIYYQMARGISRKMFRGNPTSLQTLVRLYSAAY